MLPHHPRPHLSIRPVSAELNHSDIQQLLESLRDGSKNAPEGADPDQGDAIVTALMPGRTDTTSTSLMHWLWEQITK
jgi:hypothetical protein